MAGRPFIKGGSKLADDMESDDAEVAGVGGAEAEAEAEAESGVEGGFSRLENSTDDGGICRTTFWGRRGGERRWMEELKKRWEKAMGKRWRKLRRYEEKKKKKKKDKREMTKSRSGKSKPERDFLG